MDTLMCYCRLLTFLIFLLRTVPNTYGEPRTATRCEPIRVGLCGDLGYDVTGLSAELQAEAELTLQTFTPLIQYGCSDQLRLFLCAVHVPMCTEKVAKPIGPCRGLCETVRARCYPVLQGFGFPWPAALNCSNFPVDNNHENMCMEGPGESTGHIISPQSGPGHQSGVADILAGGPMSNGGGLGVGLNGATMTTGLENVVGSGVETCPGKHINIGGRCAPLCDANILWSSDDKRLAEIWLQVWSAACFIASAIALLGFLLEPARYPRRPLAALALCQALGAAGWGVRALAGRRDVSCVGTVAPQALALDGLNNPNCAVVFLLVYYFGMAACVWWTVLCMCWALSAARGWTHERLMERAQLFHLVAWGLPAAQTAAALARRLVDADELTGICYVGNHNSDSLVLLVLFPHITYLVSGVLCLIWGFIGLKHRPQTLPQTVHPVAPAAVPLTGSVRRNTPNSPEQLKKLGVLAAIYTVPFTCIVIAEMHELFTSQQIIADPLVGSVVRSSVHVVTSSKPVLWLALLKIFMSLIMGVTAIAWVWSAQTFNTFRDAIRRLLLPRSATYKQAPLAHIKCVPLQNMSTPRFCAPPPPSSATPVPSLLACRAHAPPSTHRSHHHRSKHMQCPQPHRLYHPSGSETIL